MNNHQALSKEATIKALNISDEGILIDVTFSKESVKSNDQLMCLNTSIKSLSVSDEGILIDVTFGRGE